MLHRLRFVIGGLVIILINQAVTFAVSASMPATLRPAGSVRFAMASTDVGAYPGTAGTWEPTGLATSITVPAGKTADVTVLFCAVVVPVNTYIKVRGKVGAALLLPNQYGTGFVISSEETSVSRCMNFYKTNVRAGTRTVRIEWLTGNNAPELRSRSMIVILNIH